VVLSRKDPLHEFINQLIVVDQANTPQKRTSLKRGGTATPNVVKASLADHEEIIFNSSASSFSEIFSCSDLS
jgi:hypothetical protein